MKTNTDSGKVSLDNGRVENCKSKSHDAYIFPSVSAGGGLRHLT